MKSAIIAALLSILAFNSYAQESQKEVQEKPLIIYSSQGRIEIKNPSNCTQHRSDKGSIAITCENQCKQTINNKDGEVLIQC
jgi:hypothetical protein